MQHFYDGHLLHENNCSDFLPQQMARLQYPMRCRTAEANRQGRTEKLMQHNLTSSMRKKAMKLKLKKLKLIQNNTLLFVVKKKNTAAKQQKKYLYHKGVLFFFLYTEETMKEEMTMCTHYFTPKICLTISNVTTKWNMTKVVVVLLQITD